jgi:cytochrome c-type biogenesis protein
VLGAILFYAGASASLALGGMLLALYALGFALPFIAIGVGWASGLHMLGWARRYGRVVTIASGVALIVIGIFYLSGQMYYFSIWAQHAMPPIFQ